MPTVTRVRVGGLRELGEAMRRLSVGITGKDAAQAVSAGARIVRNRAKANISSSPSVDKGYLLSAVIQKKIPKTQTRLTAEYIVTVRGRGKKSKKTGKVAYYAPHASFIEFGTVNMPAEPFLGPAMASEARAATDAIADRLKQRIAKAGKK